MIFGRGDLGFALAAATAVLLTAQDDLWLRSEALENPDAGRGLARLVEPLGNSGVVLSSLAGGYALAHIDHDRPAASHVSEVASSVLATGAEVLLLKEVAGRSRPSDAPEDNDQIRPLSGNTSFPSGHAAIAFATAESIDRAWGNHWSPWLTYPAAMLVGWSRVHDDRHWTSDVVAGAALGVWTARKVHRLRADGSDPTIHLGLDFFVLGRGPGVALTLR